MTHADADKHDTAQKIIVQEDPAPIPRQEKIEHLTICIQHGLERLASARITFNAAHAESTASAEVLRAKEKTTADAHTAIEIARADLHGWIDELRKLV